MNDLHEVRELWSEATEPGDARMAAVRGRLLEETRQPGRARTRTPGHVWTVRMSLAGGLVAAATAGAVLLPYANGPGSTPANAAELLDQAATAAEHGKAINPLPHQFVYQETTALEVSFNSDVSWFRKVRYQQWQRADGSIAPYRRKTLLGLLPLPGKKLPALARQTEHLSTNAQFLPCTAKPAEPNAPYALHSKLPTDPARLRNALTAGVDAGQRAELSLDQAVWTNLTALASVPTPPKVQAALFKLARQIKGASLTGPTTDIAGRRGLAVTYNARPGEREDLIFDAKTYRFLGTRSVTTDASKTMPRGTTTADLAVTKTAVVDNLPVPSTGHPCPPSSTG
ncbi:CU044_5270 family protein [Actinomadura barringtoniae]|uniref:CU044_5270 family protein n=1 Tax=Actinomadura barringtoniae TaxID=1427535 RepID=A0A939PIP7_9ACTN|nr:CU044_5270 family protein [Actinomadura barringtoniae]MBO2453446.1 CU044_5270 family protein [Actinomadura barringtoniae]